MLAHIIPLFAALTLADAPVAPATPPTEAAPGSSTTPDAARDDGAWRIPGPRGYTLTAQHGTASYRLTVGGLLQSRFTWVASESGDDTFAISVPRARLILGGHLISPDLTWSFMTEFGGGNTYVRDYFVDYAFDPALRLRFGQWRRPHSRQHISASSRLALVDRTLTDAAFRAGRDLGVALHNGYDKGPPFEWVVGVFNGGGEVPRFRGSVAVDPVTGEGRVTSGGFSNVPDRFEPVVIARVAYNSADMVGGDGYSETDRAPARGPRVSVGASALLDLGLDDAPGEVVVSVDTIVKAAGFAATIAGYGRFATDETTGNEALGFYVQGSYTHDLWLETTARYTRVEFDDDARDPLDEVSLGLTVYFAGDHLKWQVDGSALGHDDQTDYRLRTQLQLAY